MTYRTSFKSIAPHIVLYCVSQLAIAAILGSTVQTLLLLQVTFDPARARQLLAELQPDDLVRLKAHFYLDFIHPFLYGRLLFLLLKVREASRHARFWTRLPVLACVCDLVENCLELYILRDPHDLHVWATPMAASFSTVKWLAVAMILFLLSMTKTPWKQSRS